MCTFSYDTQATSRVMLITSNMRTTESYLLSWNDNNRSPEVFMKHCRIADIVEDFIQVLKYIVYIFKAFVYNLKAIVMVHLFNGSVLILMTRGQTGFEDYSVCYAFEKNHTHSNLT